MTIKTELEVAYPPERFRELVKKYSREFRIGILGKADSKELMRLRDDIEIVP